MERRDLFEDDLTEERQPTPAQREDVAESETLDPDESAEPNAPKGDRPPDPD